MAEFLSMSIIDVMVTIGFTIVGFVVMLAIFSIFNA